MASAAVSLASFGDGFVTVCSYMGAPIAVGTCNWADHSAFYPPELERGRRQRDKLSFYAEYFPVVEIDTTFYGIPRPQVVDGWVERTPGHFRFNIKAYRSLTGHEREDRIPRKPTAEEERDFMAALEPLRSSGKLVAVHYQFPPWLTNSPDSRGYVAEVNYLPWLNTKLQLQYVAYDKFNGGKQNYDGAGRNASDNNTLYLLGWVLF